MPQVGLLIDNRISFLTVMEVEVQAQSACVVR